MRGGTSDPVTRGFRGLSAAVALLALAAAVLLLCRSGREGQSPREADPFPTGQVLASPSKAESVTRPGKVYFIDSDGQIRAQGERPARQDSALCADGGGDEDGKEAETALRAWEKITDEFAEPLGRKPTAADVARFRNALRRLPAKHRAENLRAAINLIPDDNFEVLAALVTDRSQPSEIIDMCFADLLNRSDELKSPVLRRIAADREHPNVVDARRIVDIERLGDRQSPAKHQGKIIEVINDNTVVPLGQ